MREQQEDEALVAPIDEVTISEAHPLTGLPAFLAAFRLRYIVRPRLWWGAWYRISIHVPQPDGSHFTGVTPKSHHPHYLLRRALGRLGHHTEFTIEFWTRDQFGEPEHNVWINRVA